MVIFDFKDNRSSMIQVSIINQSHHPLPSYQTKGASGMDLHAFLSEPITLQPLERRLIPTGLFIEIPLGFEVQIRPRSGLAIKRGLSLVNTPGTIDSDYRGEIMIPLINLSQETQMIEDGDRIAQMILAKYEVVEWQLQEQLSSSDRGTQGFGHTGI